MSDVKTREICGEFDEAKRDELEAVLRSMRSVFSVEGRYSNYNKKNTIQATGKALDLEIYSDSPGLIYGQAKGVTSEVREVLKSLSSALDDACIKHRIEVAFEDAVEEEFSNLRWFLVRGPEGFCVNLRITTLDYGVRGANEIGIPRAVQHAQAEVEIDGATHLHVLIWSASAPMKIVDRGQVEKYFPGRVMSFVEKNEGNRVSIDCLSKDGNDIRGAAALAATIKASWEWCESPGIIVLETKSGTEIEISPSLET